MTYGNDHTPTRPTIAKGMVVARPRETDAIGQALSCAFGPVRALPRDLDLALRKLDWVQ